MKQFLKIIIIIFAIIVSLIATWFSLDKTTRCKLIYGKNICNFYAMMEIISHNPETSDFEKAMQLCWEMEDVPKKDSCFEYIAQVVAFYNPEKAKEACDEIKEFNSVHSKKDCYDKIIEIQSKRKVVKTYLEENIWKTTFGGKTFCAYEVLGEGNNLYIHRGIQYMWVLCEEYYLKNNKLRKGGGTSLPVALVLQKENHIYKVISHKIPRDGKLYVNDIKRIFPEDIQNKIFSNDYNRRIEVLSNEIKKEVELYFDNPNKP